MVVAAEVLLVVGLVALNVYLWVRPAGRDAARIDAPATAVATPLASGATTAATPAPTATSASPASPASTPSRTTPATTAPTSSRASASSAAPAVDVAAALKKAGRLVVVVDTSAGMTPHLDAVKAGLTDLVRQAPDGVSLGLVTYSPEGINVAAEPAAMDAGRRDALTRTVGGLTTKPGADRPLFDALVLAYQHVLAGNPGADPAPILMTITDGGRQGGTDLQTFLTFARAESAKRARPADPVFIAISPGADVPLLTQVAAELGGKVVVADTDDRIRAAILDLPTPGATRP